MDKAKLQTLKGFRDFLPKTMVLRNELAGRLRSVFERFGYEELQSPSLEYQEVLLGKYGEEAEKLMYLFEDRGGRKVGLKYDLTIPLARVITSNPNLTFPLKRYQIQPVWRADKPQKGRYREIYMCDVDIIGISSPIADAEIVAIVNESLKALGFPDYTIHINSRQVLFSSMEKAEIPESRWPDTIQSVDKLDKKSQEEVEEELVSKGLKQDNIKAIFSTLAKAQPDSYLKQTIDLAKQFGVGDQLVFYPNLARGLDYYTGPIFETQVNKPKIGSITGGGRYDKLLKTLGGPDLPAVGTTIGLDRAADVIEELNLWPNLPTTKTKVLVTVFNKELLNNSSIVVNNLRQNDINAEIFPDENANLKKQLKYADKKGIRWLVVIGPDEVKKDTVMLKNLQTGHQEEVKLKDIVKKIKSNN